MPSLLSVNECLTLAVKNYAKQISNFYQISSSFNFAIPQESVMTNWKTQKQPPEVFYKNNKVYWPKGL